MQTELSTQDKLKLYPKTENFEVIDTMGVPHAFCITHHHLNFSPTEIYLDADRIRRYEKHIGKPSCGIKGCNLMFDQHEQALAVRCRTKDKDETQAYLKSIVEQCEKDGFAGFVLVDGTNAN